MTQRGVGETPDERCLVINDYVTLTNFLLCLYYRHVMHEELLRLHEEHDIFFRSTDDLILQCVFDVSETDTGNHWVVILTPPPLLPI